MLTAKQEKFVQELIKNGGNQSAAYRAAYDTSKMKEKTITQKACRLFQQGNIRARYDEIQGKVIEKTADDAASMRAFIIQKLKEIASGELTDIEEGRCADGSWGIKKRPEESVMCRRRSRSWQSTTAALRKLRRAQRS